MKNYPFSFEQLKEFSESSPYLSLSDKELELFNYLNHAKKALNFPAVTDDIGNLLRFLTFLCNPEYIFEFGSGYGHSAFWYSLGASSIKKVYLCEKRDDLLEIFEKAPWDLNYKKKLDYFQGDAFENFNNVHNIDFLLIDGVKGDYLEFLELAEKKMSKDSFVVIDNSYWRGSFLDADLSTTKKSAMNIKKLHEFIGNSKTWDGVFIPFVDGLTLLRKLS